MFPIPILFIATQGGIVPVAGLIKKVITLDYPDGGGVFKNSLAILLTDGRLFMQGANVYGEITDGTRNERYNTFYLASTTAADVFAADRSFIIKYNNGGWQYSGLLAGLVGSTAAGGADVVATTWTSLPSSITSIVTLANLKEVKGSFNNTLWWMNNGQLYGSGQNTVGSLGSGNTNQIPTPRSISTVALKFDAAYNQCTYLNNAGALRVCGASRGVSGANSTTTSFVNAALVTGETIYVKDYVSNVSQTLIVGAPTADSTTNFLYLRKNAEVTYTKVAEFASGFSTWRFPEGRQAYFFALDNKYWAMGVNYTANLGFGYANASTDPVVPKEPKLPAGITKWNLNLMNSTHSVLLDLTNRVGYSGTFQVYNGVLYYSGVWVDGKMNYLLDSELNYLEFTPIADSEYLGVLATSVSTASIFLSIKGATFPLGVTVDPENGTVFNGMFSTSDANVMTIDQEGTMTFVDDGPYIATFSGKNSDGTILTSSSSSTVETLGVTVNSLDDMLVGDGQQASIVYAPENAQYLPDMEIVFYSSDYAVADIDENDAWVTALGPGECDIFCALTYQGTVTALGSTHLVVTAPIPPKPPVYDGVDYELIAGKGLVRLDGGLNTTQYQVNWGDGSPVQTHASTSGASLAHTYATAGPFTCTVTVVESTLTATQHQIVGAGLLSVSKWPTRIVPGVEFTGSTNLIGVPDYLPASFTTLRNMFNACPKFNYDISGWDTSNITSLENIFNGATVFNQPIGSWDVSNVVTLAGAFAMTKAFSQPLNNWNVSKNKSLQNTFYNCVFNQPLNNWNTSLVTDMRTTFQYNVAFIQDISMWNTSKISTYSNHANFAGSTNAAWTAAMKPTFAV